MKKDNYELYEVLFERNIELEQGYDVESVKKIIPARDENEAIEKILNSSSYLRKFTKIYPHKLKFHNYKIIVEKLY